MANKTYIGIDPGSKGFIAVMHPDGTPHLPEGLPPAVTLAPLLLTRGRHRKKDPACWQGFLEAAGYHAEARDLYLTELPEVRAMFEAHSRQALSEEVNL